ncbi:MAG: hypothetical protein ABEJ95_07585 [Candidatus Nanohalobium sp.]
MKKENKGGEYKGSSSQLMKNVSNRSSEEESKKPKTIRFNPTTDDLIRDLAESSGISFAETVRRLLRDSLEDMLQRSKIDRKSQPRSSMVASNGE